MTFDGDIPTVLKRSLWTPTFFVITTSKTASGFRARLPATETTVAGAF